MPTREPTRPSEVTVKQLFARSGNQCAYPKCPAEIVQDDVVVGKICHIKAAKPGGPRYDTDQSAVDRHGYGNLILLCGTHHTVIDDDEEVYTVERLTKMKKDHEGRATAMSADDIDRGTRLLLDQSVISINQSGGITAHTVNQTVHLHPPGPQPGPSAQRQAAIATIAEFHRERVGKIAAGEAPVAILDGGALILHVVPFSAVDGRAAPSFGVASSDPHKFPPVGTDHARDSRISYDGLLIGSNVEGLSKPQRAYVQLFRTGAVESVVSSLARGQAHNFLQFPELQTMIIKYANIYAIALSAAGILPTFLALVSMTGVASMRLLQRNINGSFPEDLQFGALDRATYSFGEAFIETAPAHYRETAGQIRPILDHLANAAGLPASPDFDQDGNFLL